MSYSGMYIKENATIQDLKDVIDSYYKSVIYLRDMEAKMRIQNEEYRKEYEKRILEAGTSGTSGTSGCYGVSCSNNSKEFIGIMVSQAYLAINKCPINWIGMWKEKFKNDPEVLMSFDRHSIPLTNAQILRKKRKEKLNKINN